jgi:hypothetical protein
MNSNHLILFQYGPVHEEVSLPFITACNRLHLPLYVSLNLGSINAKGDIFDALSPSEKCLHTLSYRKGISGSKIGDHLIKYSKNLQEKKIIFLTLQDPHTIELARFLQSNNFQVAGIIHNSQKLANSPTVLNFWKTSGAVPIALSGHVANQIACLLGLKTSMVHVIHSVFEPADKYFQSYRLQEKMPVTLALPGGINYDNRPYPELLSHLSDLRKFEKCILNEIIFHILGGGKDRELLKSDIEKAGLSEHFSFTEIHNEGTKTTYSEYYKKLSECDYVFSIESGKYSRFKITSTIPTAISFLKPLVCSNAMIKTYTISGAAFDANKLAKTLPSLKNWEQRKDAAEYSYKLREKHVAENCNAIRALFP